MIDGHEVLGHHRWEATALEALIEGQHFDATSACPLPVLQAVLAAAGQERPLNRKQISRLWEGLAAMFGEAHRLPALSRRLGHPPRGRTVGPWWWARQPGDTVQVSRSTDRRVASLEQPAVARPQASPEQFAALCQLLMVCQALWIDGRLAEASQLLGDDSAWRAASTETQAFRNLRLAEVHLQRREFDAVARDLVTIDSLLVRSVAARVYLLGSTTLLRQRLAYAQSPTTNYPTISSALATVLARAPGVGHPEVDRLTRGLALNLAALCERRQLEAAVARHDDAAANRYLASALRYSSAALFGFITSELYERAQNLCSNVAYLLQRAVELGLPVRPETPLEWYAVAQICQNRFDLADNNVWECVFLGDFWLRVPAARAAFAAMAPRVAWSGRRPDRLDFYQHGWRRAWEIGEPRQQAHTALNLWTYAREFGPVTAARTACDDLRTVLARHPDVRRILLDEGYHLPAQAA